ncbi:MAG: PAS domain S-box protein [Desulfovibrionaceae bacterium]|nr:PAS domain S-box protein [Desulfovibrionaceae bacterium]
MSRQQEWFFENEAWLKERVLEFAGTPLGESAWRDFFSRLVASAPDSGDRRQPPAGALESVSLPMLALDEDLVVTWQNRAAADLLGGGEGASLRDAAPWLAGEVDRECARKEAKPVVRFAVGRQERNRTAEYAVTLSGNGSGRFMALYDVTAMAEARRQLARERDKSARYLDAVGVMVVVLDASSAVTMLNQTAVKALGYGMHDLLGRNWVDAVVPKERRDEVRDYIYHIFYGQTDGEGELVYHVTTGSGEARMVQWQHKLLTNEGGLPIGILCSGIDITDQRTYEDTLAEKELWLRSTFVALGEAVLILTPEWNVLDANPAAEAMFGMTNQELVDSPVEMLHVDGAHEEDFKARCRDAFDRGERAMFEFPLRREDGEVFPSEHSVSLIIGDDGHPLGIVNTIKDISDRKRSERILKESEEKFRRIFESIEEGYIVTDLEGVIQMVNPATCRLFGYSEEELVGTTMDKLYLDKEKQTLSYQAIIRGAGIRGVQAQAVKKDGTVITLDGNGHLVLDAGGNPIGMEGTFRDITRRIEAGKVLKEREQQYRAFFENNHAIMLLVEPKTGNVVDANPAACQFYGYSRKKMLTMNMSQINALDEEAVFREMQLAWEEKRTHFILKHVLSDGSFRDVEVYSGPIMVQGHQLLYSVIHDVTTRIRLEAEMKTLATTDALTGVDNRHQFFCAGSRELGRSQRYRNSLILIMLDIDYFKSINDTYGHQAGDEVLRRMARRVSSLLRESDLFGRLGGEEFAVVLPETGITRGMEVAERLRRKLADLKVEFEGRAISFTVSMGVTLACRSDRIIEDIIKRADEALYKAKRMGRNRVERG